MHLTHHHIDAALKRGKSIKDLEGKTCVVVDIHPSETDEKANGRSLTSSAGVSRFTKLGAQQREPGSQQRQARTPQKARITITVSLQVLI